MITAAARPRVHFTTERGWLNDPHGIIWHGGMYHLFYQWVPDSTVWSPRSRWGHAVSPDLLHWRAQPPALTPSSDELGCWSGTSVVTASGELDLFYTRVFEGDLGQGQIVMARPAQDGEGWTADPTVPAVAPPPELQALSFRDPCVFRLEDHWVMVVGAGLPGGRGALVHFTSPDLLRWTYTGVAASRPTTETEPAWSGAMWECPQLFSIDDTWVLIVSVWLDDVLYYVVAATGSYDGRTFTPTHWQQLTFGSSAYAMTSFVDRDGRRCVTSWLREGPDFDAATAERTGAHSLPYLVTINSSGAVRLSLHPNVELLRRRPAPADDVGGGRSFSAAEPLDIELSSSGTSARLLLSEGARLMLNVPIHESSRIVIDGGTVEISGESGLTVHRLGATGPGCVATILGDDVSTRAWTLSSAWADE